MIAIYVRVSTFLQSTESQEREIKAWERAQDGIEVKWYIDKASGTNMDRKAMNRLLVDIRAGIVQRVVVWRLDRLGRTTRGLLEFFDELRLRRVGFLSLRESIDLDTPAGRLLLTMLSSVAQYETEVRSERQRAGIAAVRAKNGGKCPWGGRKKGTRIKVSIEKESAVKTLRLAGHSIPEIVSITGLSRPTIYRLLSLPSQPADTIPSS